MKKFRYPHVVRFFVLGLLFIVSLYLTIKSVNTATHAALIAIQDLESVSIIGGFVDDAFDEFREVRTNNGIIGSTRDLAGIGGISITQACQLRMSVSTNRFSGINENSPVYLFATVDRAKDPNRTINNKEVRILLGVVGRVIGGDLVPVPCETYSCPTAGSPCDPPICPGRYYAARVAFISRPQLFGAPPPDFGSITRTFMLEPSDVVKLQTLIDLYGPENIKIGGGSTITSVGAGISFFREGDATINTTASITNPPGCTGPGRVVTVTANVTNPSDTPQAASISSLLPAQLLALPGTCSASVGACMVVNSSTVTYSGTLAPNQTATITYQAQVADGTPPGANLCISSSASIPGNCRTVTACVTVNCSTGGVPGVPITAAGAVSDQKPGSVLFYNLYTSNVASPGAQNTRINLTNTDAARTAFVHLFFVDGSTCSVADAYICLTPNQTASFLASDLDPDTTGYIVAIASDGATGCPINFNALIGDEYVKLSTGHAANLAAEAFSAIAGGLPFCNQNSTTATLAFDGISYNQSPRVLALDNIPSRADNNDTLLVINRVGGNLGTGAATLTDLFGILYDDAENALSFTFNPRTCQFRSSLSNSFPRTTPRVEQFIPAGRSGWLKIWSVNDQGLLGAALNFNPNATTSTGAYNQGHNLHKLRLTPSMVYTIPIFPPSC